MERRKRRSPVEEYIDSLMDSPENLKRCTNFYRNLRSFYRKKWNSPFKPPHVQGVELNLFRLYDTVVSYGGWQKVSMNEKWHQVVSNIGVPEGVAVAEHAIKFLYMRYLSKYEQNDLTGDVEDNESDVISSRGRGKGFSSMANADCPISSAFRPSLDNSRPLIRMCTNMEYEPLIKSLLSGLPNEVDFAMNVCTLLSHPGPRVLQLSAAPQLMTILVAHVGIFPDDDCAIHKLYEGWKLTTGRDFIDFWRGAGITDTDILSLIPYVRPSVVKDEEKDIFCGLEVGFEPANVISWRVHQVLSIMRNLSFETVNRAIMASNWSLQKFLFVCADCKWSLLRTAALDALSNLAVEIDLTSLEAIISNHLLLKIVSRCLHSSDKVLFLRGLEILTGLCNKEWNESLLCEFLDQRILGQIFDAMAVKDVMICVYTLEAVYQISELGAAACHQLSHFPHATNLLISLATIEAVSFAPSGLSGMKVVEYHGASQFPSSKTPTPSSQILSQAVLPQALPPQIVTSQPIHSLYNRANVPTAHTISSNQPYHRPPVNFVSSTQSRASTSTPMIGDSKVERLTAKWIGLNCTLEMGNIVPRGELYACYVEDLRNNYNALSGSVQMFTNIMKTIFPKVVVRPAPNGSSMIFENIKLAKNIVIKNAVRGRANHSRSSSAIASSYPLMQRMLSRQTTVALSSNGLTPEVELKQCTVSSPVAATIEHQYQPPSMSVSGADAPKPCVITQSSQIICATAGDSREGDIYSANPSASLKDSETFNSGTSKRWNGQFDQNNGNIETKLNGCSTDMFAACTTSQLETTTSTSGNLTNDVNGISSNSDMINEVEPSFSSKAAVNQDALMVSRETYIRVEEQDGAAQSASSLENHPDHSKRKRLISSGEDENGEYLCEWDGCGRLFSKVGSILEHCVKVHVADDKEALQCHWPKCDPTVRRRWSMITHLQDHHCSEGALKLAAQRKKEGFATPLGPVRPERVSDISHQFSNDAAFEAIQRHAFSNISKDFLDETEGPVTKCIRLTSCLIMRNLARYSHEGRRVLRRHERLLSALSLSQIESSSAVAQLLAELHCQSTS